LLKGEEGRSSRNKECKGEGRRQLCPAERRQWGEHYGVLTLGEERPGKDYNENQKRSVVP